MAWPLEKLKDCCTVVGGATPKRGVPEYWGHDVPWITPKDISNLNHPVLEDAPEYISKTGFENSATFMLPKGSILLTSRAPIGNVAIAGRSMCTNQGFKSLIPSDRVHSSYLYHCIRKMSRRLQALGNGATFKEVSKRVVEEFEITLPPLEEQKHIAAILDKADVIRRKRQQAIDLTDQLLRSVFLDMFGDPLVNTKGWDILDLNSLCTKITDGTHDTPKREVEGVPYITGKHIRPFKIDFENSDFVSEAVHKEIFRRCNPEKGDVLYTNIGVNLGTAALNTVAFEFSMKNVALLKPDAKKVSGDFLVHLLNESRMKEEIKRIASLGGAQSFLGLKDIKSLKVFVPPLELQNKFVDLVRKMRKSNIRRLKSKKLNNDLFSALTQRAFRGELTKQSKAA